jgi:hypothetical protein
VLYHMMNESTATVGPFGGQEHESARNGTTGSSFAAGTSGPSVPSVRLPSGGGSIRGMGENIAMNAAMGTATWTVPLGISKSRQGAQPPLSLQYSTGAGNGIFGLGWGLAGCPEITRKTAPVIHDLRVRPEGWHELHTQRSPEGSISGAQIRASGGTYLQ